MVALRILPCGTLPAVLYLALCDLQHMLYEPTSTVSPEDGGRACLLLLRRPRVLAPVGNPPTLPVRANSRSQDLGFALWHTVFFSVPQGRSEILRSTICSNCEGWWSSSAAYLVSHHRNLGYGERRCGFNAKHESTKAPAPHLHTCSPRPPHAHHNYIPHTHTLEMDQIAEADDERGACTCGELFRRLSRITP